MSTHERRTNSGLCNFSIHTGMQQTLTQEKEGKRLVLILYYKVLQNVKLGN